MYLHTLLGFSIYNLFYYFVIYSFLGWCTEVTYAFYSRGKFVNRGFLNGPFCPIYGFGALSLVVFLTPFKNNIFLLFILSIILTSLLEYVTGFILEKAFNTNWWDYSDNKFNVKGRICLSFSIAWGLVSIVIVKFIHPFIDTIVSKLPITYGLILYYSLIIYFLIDFSITLGSLIELNKILNQLNDISKELKYRYSSIKDAALEKVEDMEFNIKDLRVKYDNVFSKIKFNQRRILKAFPDVSSKRFDHILKDIKLKIHSKK